MGRVKVTIWPLDNGKHAAVCEKVPAPAPPPVRTASRLADHAAPLPAAVLARCAGHRGHPRHAHAGARLAVDGDGPWQCPPCALAADETRRAAA